MDELTRLLTTGPAPKPISSQIPRQWTPRIEIASDEASIVAEPRKREAAEWDQESLIRDAGLDPADWEVITFRKGEWQTAGGEWLQSLRLQLRPRGAVAAGPDIAELVAAVNKWPALTNVKRIRGIQFGSYVHAIGDLQLGKIDADGPSGTVDRVAAALRDSVQAMLLQGHSVAHIAFLGDCIEGFVSQGGANTWRTGLTLTEQIRLTRRIMLAHVEAFAPHVERLTVVSVPGNHDEAIRVGGKGTTRYDDSFAVDALHAVAEACALNPEAFGHVEFYTPEPDELTVTLDIGGTVITHAHGHQWRNDKHWEWLDAQAGNRQPAGAADVLLSAHKHHLVVQERGPRTFLQIPAMEAESTWWRHRTGQPGNPGVLTFTAADGGIGKIEVIR